MAERPILFQGAMIRALLAGTKSQTRRAIKPQPPAECGIHYMLGNESWLPHEKRSPLRHTWEAWGGPLYRDRPAKHLCGSHDVRCPYGAPGDRLWVRESFAFTDAHEPKYEGSIEYRADNKCMAVSSNELFDVPHNCDPRPFDGPWSPSIHMPRWASRILLEVTEVRAQRLQEISEVDAVAEGLTFSAQARKSESCMGIYECRMPDGLVHFDASAVSLYRKLSEQINGAGSWDANPWVWAVSFRQAAPQGRTHG